MLELYFFQEDGLWMGRKENHLETWLSKLGCPYHTLSVRDSGESILYHSRGGEDMLLLTSENLLLNPAKELGIPVLGVELVEQLWADYIICDFWEIDLSYLEKVAARQSGKRVLALETERCILREIQLTDLDRLYELYEEASIKRFMEPLFPRDEEEEYTKAYRKNIYPFYDFGMWIVEDKKSGEIIGRAGCDVRAFEMVNELENADNYKAEDLEYGIELGYMVSEKYQGRGIATELCKSIMQYMAANTGYPLINCLIEDSNIASIHMVEKLGFTYLGNCKTEDGKQLGRYVKALY